MKKIILIIIMTFIITGCIDDKIESGINKLTVIGKYKCLCDSSGIEYTMTYEFSSNKIKANVNNQTTELSYSLKNDKLTTINAVTGKEMVGELDNNKLVFTEKDSEMTITCEKQ